MGVDLFHNTHGDEIVCQSELLSHCWDCDPKFRLRKESDVTLMKFSSSSEQKSAGATRGSGSGALSAAVWEKERH